MIKIRLWAVKSNWPHFAPKTKTMTGGSRSFDYDQIIKLIMIITDLALATQLLIGAVINRLWPKLEIARACLYTITILYAQDCVIKVMIIGIHFQMNSGFKQVLTRVQVGGDLAYTHPLKVH